MWFLRNERYSARNKNNFKEDGGCLKNNNGCYKLRPVTTCTPTDVVLTE
jgi:hypothetical protein